MNVFPVKHEYIFPYWDDWEDLMERRNKKKNKTFDDDSYNDSIIED